MSKIFGFIPVRMKSSRFPGKPLKKIINRPMLHHVYERAKLFNRWSGLYVCSCDRVIQEYCKQKNYPFIITSKKHRGCLDRVFEATKKNKKSIRDNDIVVCIQGDEPMLEPYMIQKLLKPFKKRAVKVTVLALALSKMDDYYNPNLVKLIHDKHGKVLIGTRAPAPFYKNFKRKNYSKRIVGIFAFKFKYLKKYFTIKPTPLEIIESCDTNRICETFGGFYLSLIKNKTMYAVDTYKDLKKVEKLISKDDCWRKY